MGTLWIDEVNPMAKRYFFPAPKRDPLEIVAIGILLILVPLAGIIQMIFPTTNCPTCGLLDVGCYASLPGCMATQATIGAWQGIVSTTFTFVGLLVLFYGIYKFVRH
jgi:hypothetical protein